MIEIVIINDGYTPSQARNKTATNHGATDTVRAVPMADQGPGMLIIKAQATGQIVVH